MDSVAASPRPLISWPKFSQELLERFGDDSAINAYEALYATRHTGALKDYISLFEARVAQLPDFPEAQLLGFFLGGLKKYIRDQIHDNTITDLSSAIRAARKVDRASRPPQHFSKPVSRFSGYSSRPLLHSRAVHSLSGGQPPSDSTDQPQPTQSTTPASSQGSSDSRGNRNARHMSHSEYLKHRVAGTCFCCGLQFGPLHHCTPKTFTVMVREEEQESEEPNFKDTVDTVHEPLESLSELQQLQLSELTPFGLDGPRTMKLFGCVGAEQLLLMMDIGASHCFISERMASQLQLDIDSSLRFFVLLANGTRVLTRGLFKNVPLLLDYELFHISCYVFPLSGVDLILGVSRLATLGEVKTNWATLNMEFSYKGSIWRLQRDPALARRVCVNSEIQLLEEGDQCWVLWALDGNKGLAQFGVSDRLTEATREELIAILSPFPGVITTPSSLPPMRSNDHRIVLQPGSQPVSIRPYRYNHSQKDEMERLVMEMLAAGIIQPSSSPYSSPVLLVRKKDGS